MARGGKLRVVWSRPDGAAPRSPGDRVSRKKRRCPLSQSGPTSERAPWARGRRPLLRRGLCRWPSRRRRNMAPKVSPSGRLVFCLLISAAVLRPGKQWWPLSSQPTVVLVVARGRFPGWPGTVCSSAWWLGKSGSWKGARGRGPVSGNSHLCHTF